MEGRTLYQVIAPYFTVGLEVENQRRIVLYAGPIIRFMVGWKWHQVEAYCDKKGWKLTDVAKGLHPKEPKT
jgi:hypothetical protein